MSERVRRRKSRWDEEKVTCDVPVETREEDVPSAKNEEFIHNDMSQTECMSPKWSDIDMEISPTKNDERSDFSCWQTSSENKGEMVLEKVKTNYSGIPASTKAFGEYQNYNISPDRSVRKRRDNSRSPEGGWYRSRRSRSRSKSRSRNRSRTPPGSLIGESEGWKNRVKSGSRAPVPPINNFPVGNCMKDNQWSYPRGPGGQDGGFLEELNFEMNSKSANICYDFLDGNCIRGSSCKYSHQSAPIDHRAEKETTFKRMDVNDSYDDTYQGALLNHHEVRETTYKMIDVNGFAEDYNRDQHGAHGNKFPCKYFASGFCRNGDACRFAHEVVKDDSIQQPKYPEYMVTMDRGFDGKIVNKLDSEARVTWEVPRNTQESPILKGREVVGDVSEFTPWLNDEDVVNKVPSQGNSSSNTIVGYNYQNTLLPNPSGQKLYPSNSESSNTSGPSYQNSQPQNRNGGNSFPSNPQPGIANLGSNPPNLQPQNLSGKNIYPPNSGSSNNPNMFNHYGPQTQNSGTRSICSPNSELSNTSVRFSHQSSQPQTNPSGHNIYPPKSESSISANMGFDSQTSQPQNLSSYSSHPPSSDSSITMKTGINHQTLVPQIPNGRNMYPPNSQSVSTTVTGFNHKISLPRNPTSSSIYSPTSDSTSPIKLGLNHQKSLAQTPSGYNMYPPTNSQSANTTSTGFNRQISQPLNPTVSSFQPPSSDSSTPKDMGLKHQVSQPHIPSAQMIYPPPQSESVSITSEGLIRQSLQPSSLSAHSNHPSNSGSSTTLNMGFNRQSSQPQFSSGQNIYPSNTSTSTTTNAGPNGQNSQLQNSTGSSIHHPNSGSSTPIHMGFNHLPSQSQISSGQNLYVPNTESSNITNTGFNQQSSLPQNPTGSIGHPSNSGPASTTNMGFNHQISQPQIPSGRNIYSPNSKSTNTTSTGVNHLISQPPNPTRNSVVRPNSSSANTFATMVPTAVQNLNPSGQTAYSPTVSTTNMNQQSLHNFSLNGRSQKNSGLSSQKLDEIIQKMPMPQMTNGVPTTRNAITSEQVAQITNLSGLIPQLYAAALSSVNASSLLPNISNSGGVPVPSHFGQPNQVVLSQSQQNPVMNSMAAAMSPFQNITSAMNIPVLPSNGQVGRGYISMTGSLDKSQLEQVTNIDGRVSDPARKQQVFKGDADMDTNGHTDAGNGEKDKDIKGMRLFKAALVDFIKEALKPMWKEGQMGRETHKTIVKRVVEKVTSTTKEAQIPQTQHKIDQYLASCKPRLTKLVQAYVEKYNKT